MLRKVGDEITFVYFSGYIYLQGEHGHEYINMSKIYFASMPKEIFTAWPWVPWPYP